MTGISERLAAALADRYRIERELGQGGMATVYRRGDEQVSGSTVLIQNWLTDVRERMKAPR